MNQVKSVKICGSHAGMDMDWWLLKIHGFPNNQTTVVTARIYFSQ